MKEAVYAEMNSLACVSFTNNCETTKAVVLRRFSIFSARGAEKLGSALVEFCADQTDLVPLQWKDSKGIGFSDTCSQQDCHHQKYKRSWKAERYAKV